MDVEKLLDRMQYTHEYTIAKLEQHNKRAFVVLIISIIALIVTNGAWIARECLFDDVTTTQSVTQDADGEYITMNGIGEGYGESNTDSNNNN